MLYESVLILLLAFYWLNFVLNENIEAQTRLQYLILEKQDLEYQ